MSINLRIFNTLFSAVFVTAMGAGLVAPLLPVYAHELGAGAFQIGLVFGAFSLTRSIFVPYFGKLSDRKGKKSLLTAGLFIYFLLSLIYTTSKSVEALIALRLGQGFASAMILPVAQAYVGMITPAHKEGRIMGLFNISLYGGLSLGPLLGGVVTDWFNIQVSFLSMGVLTLFGFFLCLFFLPRETRSGIEASASSKKGRILSGAYKDPFCFFSLCIPDLFYYMHRHYLDFPAFPGKYQYGPFQFGHRGPGDGQCICSRSFSGTHGVSGRQVQQKNIGDGRGNNSSSVHSLYPQGIVIWSTHTCQWISWLSRGHIISGNHGPRCDRRETNRSHGFSDGSSCLRSQPGNACGPPACGSAY